MENKNNRKRYLICGVILLLCGLLIYAFYISQRKSVNVELDINNAKYQIKTASTIHEEMQSQNKKISLLYKK